MPSSTCITKHDRDLRITTLSIAQRIKKNILVAQTSGLIPLNIKIPKMVRDNGSFPVFFSQKSKMSIAFTCVNDNTLRITSMNYLPDNHSLLDINSRKVIYERDNLNLQNLEKDSSSLYEALQHLIRFLCDMI